MIDYSTEDLICLHLYLHSPEGSEFPHQISIRGIENALELGNENLSDRIKLMTALSNLEKRGLVEKKVAEIMGSSEQRNVYLPTEKGKEEARKFKQEAEESEVVLRDETGDTEIRIDDVMERDDINLGLVGLLSYLTDDGVLHLEDEEGDRFVNRENELEAFERIMSDSESHPRPRILFLEGETGLGKTTLLERFRDICEENAFMSLEARCQDEISEPYRVFREALNQIDETTVSGIEIGGSDKADTGTEGGGRGMLDRVFDLSGESEGSGTMPESGTGSEDDGRVESQASLEEEGELYSVRRSALFDAVSELFSELSKNQPVAFSIDDFHWADNATLDLFSHLAKNSEGNILLVATYRPDRAGETEEYERFEEVLEGLGEPENAQRHHRIMLDSFDRENTRKIMGWLIGERGLPEDFVELVYSRTGGNPLFIKETVVQMLEDGVVDPEYGVYPSSEDEMTVTGRIEEVVEKRLKGLDEKGFEILKLGAVIGVRFRFGFLNRVSDTDETELRDYLDLLVSSRILEEDETGGFRFTTAVVRGAVLDRIPDGEEKHIHGRIAETLTRDKRRNLDDFGHETVAYHYEKAGNLGKALEHYIAAGRDAEEVYAHENALENYHGALGIARDTDKRFLEVLERIGHVNYVVSNYDEAEKYFEYLQESAEDDELRRRAVRYRCQIRNGRGDYDETVELVDEEIEGMDDTFTSPEYVRLLGKKGWALKELGRTEEAIDVIELGLEAAREIGESSLIGVALRDLGSAYSNMGKIEKSMDTMEEAIEYLDGAGDTYTLAKTINNLGVMYWRSGDLEGALEKIEKALELQREIGDRGGVAKSLTNLGVISYMLGDWDDALNYYQESLEMSRKFGDRQNEAILHGNMGPLYKHKGEFDTAIKHLERSLEIEREIDNKRHIAHFNLDLAQTHLLREDPDAAESITRESLRIADEINDPETKAGVFDLLGRTYLSKNEPEKSIEYHEKGIDLAEETGSPTMEIKNRCGVSEAYLELGETAEALANAEAAHEAAEETDETTHIIESKIRLGAARGENDQFGYQEAQLVLEEAVELAKDLGANVLEAKALYELGKLEKSESSEEERLKNACKLAEEMGFDSLETKCKEELN